MGPEFSKIMFVLIVILLLAMVSGVFVMMYKMHS